MNKYSDKSDFEINKAVASALKLNTIAYDRTEIVLFDDMDATPFDPCNSWIDAGPIISGYKISMTISDDAECFLADTSSGDYLAQHDNPLKAAMICFLMMKDAENES